MVSFFDWGKIANATRRVHTRSGMGVRAIGESAEYCECAKPRHQVHAFFPRSPSFRHVRALEYIAGNCVFGTLDEHILSWFGEARPRTSGRVRGHCAGVVRNSTRFQRSGALLPPPIPCQVFSDFLVFLEAGTRIQNFSNPNKSPSSRNVFSLSQRNNSELLPPRESTSSRFL